MADELSSLQTPAPAQGKTAENKTKSTEKEQQNGENISGNETHTPLTDSPIAPREDTPEKRQNARNDTAGKTPPRKDAEKSNLPPGGTPEQSPSKKREDSAKNSPEKNDETGNRPPAKDQVPATGPSKKDGEKDAGKEKRKKTGNDVGQKPLKGEHHEFIKPADKALPPLKTILTAPFGERRFGGPSGFHIHAGIDIRAHLGWPVVALGDGEITKAGFYGNAGIMVEISQDDGYTSKYAHLQTVTVVPGQRIAKGEKIGEIGCTGFTTGAHLHFGIAINGRNIDPMKVLTSAEDIIRPASEQIPDPLGPQQCNGHMGAYTPAGAFSPRRGPVIRGRNGKARRINLKALREFKAPEIPLWNTRRR
ncbi:MAG: peptidoglycan DD-metalloendopeptidase family protein [Desulfovibrio sp.]|nr:peptidoglycan DD-metalloendopeptidase family protein [Desulfovibrio sp.]